MQPCDKKKVEEFDYSGLDKAFDKLPKPAKRALIINQIFSPSDLSKYTLEDVSDFHGIGPSAIPVLKDVLKKNRLKFK